MESLFQAVFQSSFILGIIHGINPCGHSWIVLAPFVAGNRNPGKVVHHTASLIVPGLVDRIPNDSDRRSMLVKLTPRGEELFGEHHGMHMKLT
ncbi:winged helix DNA-binding protein [Limisalsivibrio acetivorans]|uniref:winged helix DNA-binding protein n=1 Tax=Limisalsivibrio acetivorans TaxID=1304888 RepID=UPI00040CC526|nr:winged helix DNA-binding protein [Limisalsivibrio acetivorans]